ncbi:MAG: hypothetical protein WBO55_00170, partial [Rhizobiaceae bacterium]
VKMRELKVGPNQVAFNILVNKQDNYSNAWEVARNQRPPRAQIDRVTFNSILRKATSENEILNVLASMDRANLVPDSYTVSAILNAHVAIKDMLAGLRAAVENGLNLDSVSTELMGTHSDLFSSIRDQLLNE